MGYGYKRTTQTWVLLDTEKKVSDRTLSDI